MSGMRHKTRAADDGWDACARWVGRMHQMGGMHVGDGGTHAAADRWGRVRRRKMAGLQSTFVH